MKKYIRDKIKKHGSKAQVISTSQQETTENPILHYCKSQMDPAYQDINYLNIQNST